MPSFTGVYVFGDSLVDPGNDLRAAEKLGDLPFVSVPSAAPTADRGYFQGRFSDGYNFADLISNKALGEATKPTFPYGFRDPLLGLSIPFLNRPEGNNLSFAYGGAFATPSLNPAPSLDAQTDAYRNFTPDPNALYVVAIGADDVLSLVQTGGNPVVGAEADARLSAVASNIAQEVGQLVARGVRHVIVADIPDVGVTPAYTGAQDEAVRRSLLTQYVHAVNDQLKAKLAAFTLPAGATVTDYDFTGYTDAVLANPAAHGFINVTQARTVVQAGALDPAGGGFLFFDKLHPSAQAHAQIAAGMLDALSGTGAGEALAPAIGSQAASAVAVGATGSFAASLTAGRSYVVDLLGVSSGAGSLADPKVRVVDGSGAVVAQDDDGGLGLDAHLRFVVPATGQYSVQVMGVGVSSGSYHLQAEDEGGPNLLLTGQLRGSNVFVVGGGANDTIAAVAGTNDLRGGEGNDSLLGGSGFDSLNGNKGDDTLVGVSQVGDWLLGGQGNDLIDATGASGHDSINGNIGADTIIGGPGGEMLWGGRGDDVITGGAGADWLSGDRALNTLTGGGGADIFHAGPGTDLVTDFDRGQGDRVQIDAGVTYTVTQVGADTLIDLGGGRMTLLGVQMSSLTGDWIFTA